MTQQLDNFEAYLRIPTEKHVGEWLAFVDGELVAHGKNPREVYEEARKKSHKTPFMAKSSGNNILIV